MDQIDMPINCRVYGTHSWNAVGDTCTCQSSPTLSSWKIVLLMMWNDLLQAFVHIKAIVSFRNRLGSCVAAAGKHYEHSV